MRLGKIIAYGDALGYRISELKFDGIYMLYAQTMGVYRERDINIFSLKGSFHFPTNIMELLIMRPHSVRLHTQTHSHIEFTLTLTVADM